MEFPDPVSSAKRGHEIARRLHSKPGATFDAKVYMVIREWGTGLSNQEVGDILGSAEEVSENPEAPKGTISASLHLLRVWGYISKNHKGLWIPT